MTAYDLFIIIILSFLRGRLAGGGGGGGGVYEAVKNQSACRSCEPALYVHLKQQQQQQRTRLSQ